MRPCTCEDHQTGPYGPGQCRLCWLYHNDPAYRALWDSHTMPLTVACRHLGAATGATVACPSCRGTVALKLFACAIHGACTVARAVAGVACCASCPDRETE